MEAAGGGYEVSYVELGTLLPGMGQAIETTERISVEKTIQAGSRSRKRDVDVEGIEVASGCGGATQVAIFLRKDVNVQDFHHLHDYERNEAENNNTIAEQPLEVALSLKGLGLGGDISSDINDGQTNDYSHITQSQSQPQPQPHPHIDTQTHTNTEHDRKLRWTDR